MGVISLNYIERYNNWLEHPYFDEETKAELSSISDNKKEIEDRFYRDLEFGTGGMRGVIGAGTNRINRYIIRKASQGLANFLLKRIEPHQLLSPMTRGLCPVNLQKKVHVCLLRTG